MGLRLVASRQVDELRGAGLGDLPGRYLPRSSSRPNYKCFSLRQLKSMGCGD